MGKSKYYNKFMTNWEPYVEKFGEFYFVKISVAQLFKEVIPKHLKIYDWVFTYINRVFRRKHKRDYPVDSEIESWSPQTYEAILNARSKNQAYGEKFNRVKSLIMSFFTSDVNEYQCDDCGKFVINKKQHSMRCPEFKKKLDELNEEEKYKKIKLFLANNYKKLNLIDGDEIAEKMKEKKAEEICKILPKTIKTYNFFKKYGQKKDEEERQNKTKIKKSASLRDDWLKFMADAKKEAEEFARRAVEEEKKIKKKSKKKSK